MDLEHSLCYLDESVRASNGLGLVHKLCNMLRQFETGVTSFSRLGYT